jgi:probable HAF family extracellular repeat protein
LTLLVSDTFVVPRRTSFSAIIGTLLVLAALTSASPAQSAQGCAADHYRLTPLPFRPARINNSGVIAGNTEDHQAATWTEKSGLHEIKLPEGFTAAEATGINAAGDVIGFATKGDSKPSNAFRVHEKFVLLSPEKSQAQAIDDSGDVAGKIADRLFLWQGSKTISFGDCCGGIIRGINNRGQIVGELNNKDGRYDAFTWDPEHGTKLIAPTHAVMSTALAINHAGHVIVQAFTPNAIYLRQEGRFTPVQLSSEVANQPLALNDCDVIVGEFGAASDFYHAFIWDRKQGFRDLNQLLHADGWILESALDINNRGEIVGVGDHGNQSAVGFLLVPETSPAPKAQK